MPSSLPSRFSKPTPESQQAYSVPKNEPQAQHKPQLPSESSGAVIFISVLALIISLACFGILFFGEKPLSASQKQALSDIADELRALQNRDITLSAPVTTQVSIDRQYPIKDMFPETFDIPLSFSIPIDTQLIGISTTGQPASFRVQENVPIKVTIPVSSAKAFGNNTLRLRKELPIDAKFTSSVRIQTAYGTELNAIIDRLDRMAGKATPTG